MAFLPGKSVFGQKKNRTTCAICMQWLLEVFITRGYHLGPHRHLIHLPNLNLLPQPQPHPSLPDASSKGPPPCQTLLPTGLKGLGNLVLQFLVDTRNLSARPFSKSNEQKVPISGWENWKFSLNLLQSPSHASPSLIQMKFDFNALLYY